MESLPKCTLNNLINFVPIGEREKILYNLIDKEVLNKYIEDTKNKYYEGKFNLGGQIKMGPDDEITLQKFNEVRKIRKQRLIEYGGPCNSWEANSIAESERNLNDAEKIVKCYYKIGYLRELEKTGKLNSDLNVEIAEFL
jgi:hypothetical protein